MDGACSGHGGDEKWVQNLIGKPEMWTHLGRPRHRWKENIKMYLTVLPFEAWRVWAGSICLE
jgi:hypothetical protein